MLASALDMLRAQLVASVLEQSLAQSAVIACAVISTEGVVLESREQTAELRDTATKGEDSILDYKISAKLQVKIFSLFAAEQWRQSEDALWLGAEARDQRLLITPIKGESLLLLMVGRKDQSWGFLSREATETADKLH